MPSARVLAASCSAAVVLGGLLGGLAAGGAENGQIAFPASELGLRAEGWLKAFNSGDFEAMRAFHLETDPAAVATRRALHDYQVYLMTRGIEAIEAKQPSDSTIALSGREALSGAKVNVVLRGTTKAPFVITEFGLRPGETSPQELQDRHQSEFEALAEFDATLTRLSDADEFSGAALVARNGKVLFKKAWGKSNHVTGAPNRTDTRFNLASAGKMFTGVAILQLAQQGKLSLDDIVGKHLPDYANQDVREKVTIRQLLTHTSGLNEMFNAKYRSRRDSLRTVDAFVDLFKTDPLQFEPGSRSSYSNAGYCLLGAIIERASGEDYYAYIDRHIFQPAGMANTGAFETDRPHDNLAIGYTREGATSPEQLRARRDNTKMHVVKGSPAGGSYSTVEDLAAFAQALSEHKLLDADHLKLAMTPHISSGLGFFGYGFQVEPSNGHLVVGHRGGFPGISASFFMYPDDGYVVVVLSNYDSVAPVLALRMRDWIVSRAVSAGPK